MPVDQSEADLSTEVSHFDQLPPDSWVVRTCELFQEELKECTRIKGRFHQYFIHGEMLDCSGWREDLKRCQAWRKNADQKAMTELIASEKARREQRLAAQRANDVWERRPSPPPDWNAPLPDWLEKRRQRSLLGRKPDQAGASSSEELISSNKTCAVM